MRVVVAPDKFKGCLTAAQVATALGAGLRAYRHDLELTLLPVADGGDGTVDAAVAAGFTRVEVDAVGPTGQPVRAAYAMRGRVAVVELAAVVGLDRLPMGELRPLTASTFGLGLVVCDAIENGARQVVLAVGGSASTDGGAGLLQALGARLLDHSGAELPRGGADLLSVASIDVAGLAEVRAATDFQVASDVDNPLLGARGAATIFGPQKGATPAQVSLLEAAMSRWATVVAAVAGIDRAAAPGAGAAGGTAFGAMALLGAEMAPGSELVLDLVGFREAVSGADLVLTGEGSLDEQSLAGKAPIGVARAARRNASPVPVVAVVGRSLLTQEQLAAAGIERVYALSDLEPDIDRSMADAERLLVVVGRRVAAEWLA